MGSFDTVEMLLRVVLYAAIVLIILSTLVVVSVILTGTSK